MNTKTKSNTESTGEKEACLRRTNINRLENGSFSKLSAQNGGPAARRWFDYFATQLQLVADRLGLHDQQAVILKAFEAICRESLGIHSSTPPAFSRINFDGIPLQYSLALGAFEPSLQFISEARVPDSSNLAHLKLSKGKIETLLPLLAIDEANFPLTKLLDEIVSERDPDLLSDHAGALWLSPSFSAHDSPKLTIYINAKWGPANKRTERVEKFASYFGAEMGWRKFDALTRDEMEPLGIAVTLSGNSRPSGRIYLSTFGRRVEYFINLARALTEWSFDELFERYADITLGETRDYPTQSAVCSIGVGREDHDLKIELCGHCAFASDVEAKARCLEWLAYMNVDPAPYLHLTEILSEGRLSSTSSVLHAYLGVGSKRNQPYSTIYLKPHPTYAV